MKEKKILWVVTYYFNPVWAGPAERFLRYHSGFVKRGLEVKYITAQREGQAKEEVFRGGQVIRLSNEEHKTPTIRQFIQLAVKRAIREKERPSTFLVLLADLFNASTLQKLSKNGIKTVYVNTMVYQSSRSPNILKRIGSKILNRRFFNAFDTVICSTNALKQPLVKLGVKEEKLQIISNGVSLDRFKPAEDLTEKEQIRKEFELPVQEPIALFVGLRLERKGVIDLIKAWQLYKKKGGTGSLLLVGDEQRNNPVFATFYKKWDQIIKTIQPQENIIFHPPSNRIEAYFKACDLFVFLSKKEGMPNVLTEAMAAGLPVITTKFEGFSDTWGKNGEQIIVVDRDIEAIEKNIQSIINNKEFRTRLIANAKAYVEEMHDVSKSLDKYVALV